MCGPVVGSRLLGVFRSAAAGLMNIYRACLVFRGVSGLLSALAAVHSAAAANSLLLSQLVALEINVVHQIKLPHCVKSLRM